MPPQSLGGALREDSTSENPGRHSIRIAKTAFLILFGILCLRFILRRFNRRTLKASIPPVPSEKPPIFTETESIPPYPDLQTWNPDVNTFMPIYPWMSPPPPPPIPFDPNMFPSPTIRRHSYADTPPGISEESESISYTRRVSTNSIPTRQSSLIQGTVTKSKKGWRRNQWVITGE